VRKEVKWPIANIFKEKLIHIMNVFIIIEEKLRKKRRHKLSALLKEEELEVVEYEMRVYICEPG
jgi:hypothetical protein